LGLFARLCRDERSTTHKKYEETDMFEQFHGAEFLMKDLEAKYLNETLPTLYGN